MEQRQPDGFAGARFPQPGRSFFAACDQHFAIGTEGGRPYFATMTQRFAHWLQGIRLENLGPIARSSSKQLPIGAERYGINPARRTQLAPLLSVATSQTRAVPRAAGQHCFAVRTDRHRMDPVSVLKRLANRLAGRSVPQPRGLVGGRRARCM